MKKIYHFAPTLWSIYGLRYDLKSSKSGVGDSSVYSDISVLIMDSCIVVEVLERATRAYISG